MGKLSGPGFSVISPETRPSVFAPTSYDRCTLGIIYDVCVCCERDSVLGVVHWSDANHILMEFWHHKISCGKVRREIEDCQVARGGRYLVHARASANIDVVGITVDICSGCLWYKVDVAGARVNNCSLLIIVLAQVAIGDFL